MSKVTHHRHHHQHLPTSWCWTRHNSWAATGVGVSLFLLNAILYGDGWYDTSLCILLRGGTSTSTYPAGSWNMTSACCLRGRMRLYEFSLSTHPWIWGGASEVRSTPYDDSWPIPKDTTNSCTSQIHGFARSSCRRHLPSMQSSLKHSNGLVETNQFLLGDLKIGSVCDEWALFSVMMENCFDTNWALHQDLLLPLELFLLSYLTLDSYTSPPRRMFLLWLPPRQSSPS